MAEHLEAFLVDIAVDPVKLERFRLDPAAEMRAAQLTDDEMALLSTGDTPAIRRLLSDRIGALTVINR